MEETNNKMTKVKLEETESGRRLTIGSYFTDLNESDYQELVRIFSEVKTASLQKELEEVRSALSASERFRIQDAAESNDDRYQSWEKINTQAAEITSLKQQIEELKFQNEQVKKFVNNTPNEVIEGFDTVINIRNREISELKQQLKEMAGALDYLHGEASGGVLGALSMKEIKDSYYGLYKACNTAEAALSKYREANTTNDSNK